MEDVLSLPRMIPSGHQLSPAMHVFINESMNESIYLFFAMDNKHNKHIKNNQ